MKLAIQRADLFEEDFARQFAWYASQAGETIAWRFLAKLDETLRRLSQQPDLGRIRRFRDPRLRDVRSFAVEKPFGKILIFYRVSDETLSVIRLMHGARDLPRRLVEPPPSES